MSIPDKRRFHDSLIVDKDGNRPKWMTDKFTQEQCDEVVELSKIALLGFWAREHGIPALKCENPIVGAQQHEGCDICDACKALAAIPEEVK